MSNWLSTNQFAELAGIADRNAVKALNRSVNGKPWNGYALQVREIPGVGGKSGLQYEVALSSLPQALQDRYHETYAPLENDRATSEKATRLREFRYSVIRPVIDLPHKSTGRGKIVREIVSREHLSPDGQFITITEKTFYNWLKAHETGGVAALARKVDKRKGQKLVRVSARWDRGVRLPEDVKLRIAIDLRDYVRALHKNLESRSNIIAKASRDLLRWTQDAGFNATAELCRVPEPFVRAESSFRKAGTFKKDRKAHEDKRPRIRRAAGLLDPMEIVFGDVHHLDFLLTRVPGFQAYPKAVAWLDMATNRIWMDIYMLPDRQGIRNEHVIESFIRMCTAWGGPKHLYLDNGSEYNWADFIGDAMKLVREDGQKPRIDRLDRKSGLIRAKAYNAPAKTIEGVFGNLETHHFQTLPGWIGGDRTKKPTANLGKLPDPFPGTFDDFKDAIAAALKLYHYRSQTRDGGSLKGAPMEVYQRAIDAGWTATAVDADAWAVTFSEEQVKKVTQGSISHKGQWTCRELQSYQGERVTALIPKYSTWNRIPFKGEDGRLLGFAERDHAFHPLDPAGAVESEARAKAHRASLHLMAKSLSVDPVADNFRHAAMLPADPLMPVGGTVTASPEAREIAAGMAESPANRLNRQIEADLKESREAREIEANFEKLLEAKKWAS
ncbi:hypothetical protein [Pararhizobium gei]|uniref:hypothetical protein n=1 Tax=Pararhizobium gei TaxID=1395951 RepID=UPI0023DB87D4|nr:hypothetical protein [Rhizobium gei]